MEDAVESEVLCSFFASHGQLLAGIAWGALGRAETLLESVLLLLQLCLLRPEMVGVAVAIGFLTLLINDRSFAALVSIWRAVAARVPLPGARRVTDMAAALCGETPPAEWRGRRATAFAIQGLRAKMEDRFAAEEEMALGPSGRAVSVYAVYDGHGGDFAAEYTKDHLITALKVKLLELHAQRAPAAEPSEPAEPAGPSGLLAAPAPLHPVASAPGDLSGEPASPDGPSPPPLITVEPPPEPAERPSAAPARCHEAYQRPRAPRRAESARGGLQGDMLVNFLGEINYTRVLQEVFSEVDDRLLDAARREANIAGTTAVVALVDGDQVVVASCGDSRAVLCDARGNAVPLTTDHKPDQLAEKKRITEAGGFVTFNGVWRVNGILATSRALGDLPFKERRLLTCRPDVSTVSVRHHAAPFLLLASDGLWDAATGQQAVQHIRDRLHEPDLGARSLALLAYQRGSLDNITVMVVDLRPGQLGRSGSFRRQPAS
ncbi:protein phosphatase 1L-like [Amphibalanus amphitrite]|uniref:protein phosphatase 1L-like n=1 Tax=Amphibalanus amphitrite TaxID=1232801 RepID=UPI001C915E09|nr:protein phosphatase 1L-like [Amphibalanus amphitrite]